MSIIEIDRVLAKLVEAREELSTLLTGLDGEEKREAQMYFLRSSTQDVLIGINQTVVDFMGG